MSMQSTAEDNGDHWLLNGSKTWISNATWAKDQGNLNNGRDVAMAKSFAGEVANKCANYAIRIFGSYGYSPEYPIARLYKDTTTYFMYSGDSVPGLDNQQIPAFITDLYDTIPIINAAFNVECCDLTPFGVILC